MKILNLWQNFKDAFSEACLKHHLDGLAKAWLSSDDRTTFYVTTILPEVADKMGLKMRKELFKVDAAFCETSQSGHDVPLIFVESENNASSAIHEMRKLSSLNAPCRVLLVCCEWSSDLWGHSGRQDELLKIWNEIVKSHSEIWKINGTIGVINVEWGGVLRLTAASWNEHGEMFEMPIKILELT
jgi:hypothetical protein